jgi:hypothetical protein
MEPALLLMLFAAFLAGLSLGVLVGMSLIPPSEVPTTHGPHADLFSQLDRIRAEGDVCRREPPGH